MNWTQLWSLLHHKAHEQPLAHPLRPNKQLVLKSIPSQSHLCSIKIAITHNGKRCSAPKLNLEMINEVKNIKKDVGFSLLLYNYNYIRILWTFIGLAKISVYCAVCSMLFNSEYKICILLGRVLSKIHSPLLLHPSSSLFCPCDLSTFCLTDPPDLMTSHRRDTQIEWVRKRSKKANGSQKLKSAKWDSLLLSDQNSPILSLRFIFYFLHLFVTVSAIHSPLLLCYSH